MTGSLRCLWLGAAFAALAGMAGAESLNMTVAPAEARAMATRALHLGRPDLAAGIAAQILAQAPGDAEARLVLAAAQAQMGQVKAAEASARKAYRLSNDEDLRFQAAYLTASSLSAQNRLAGAKFWLRRADGASQSASDTASLRRAYAGIDRRSPLRWSVSFSGGPSDNVNGGSLHDTFWVWGLPVPIAEALPGFSLQTQIKANWRLRETETSQLMLTGAASTRQVRLSERAYALEPGARNSDYESHGLDLGLVYRWKVSDRQSFALEAQLGHRWLAAGRSSDSQKLKLSSDRALGGERFLAVDLTAVTSQNNYSTTRQSMSLGTNVGVSWPVGQGAVTGAIGYDAVLSEARGTAWRGPKVSVEYAPPALPGEVRLSLFGELQLKDYWKTSAEADVTTAIGASARFDKLSVMGFAPTLSVTATRSRSEVVVRDTAETAVALGLQSKF